ncbi:hypothetical protein H0H81_011189, partial [Sphagnurus paluster]
EEIKAAYDAEPDDIKREIEAEIERDALAKKNVKSAMSMSIDVPRTADEYAEAIEHIPDTVNHIIDTLAAQTGWTWTVLGGGPDPVLGGTLRTVR